MIAIKQPMSQACLAEQSLYPQLISDIRSLSKTCKITLNYFYDAFSRGVCPSLEQYFLATHTEQRLMGVDSQQGVVTGCFGCYCQFKNEYELSTKKRTEHLVDWSTGKVYAWCIWDAFFIVKTIGRSATITSVDPINHEQIKIYFDGVHFHIDSLWFSFPLGSLHITDSIRACFCCRTKAFTSLSSAKRFAKEYQCEVVNLAQMLERTDQMVDALSVA
ncbi:organomercurial lyase [Psychrobacter lutiphocae]|uniref:organomercurial lyase n=1 Tax=Psychrobacter lutiphocae TaxID=540500 RepID=UPI0003694063|nr:organomercurial lyase [Psychrobacter lutiphocae]